MSVTTLREKLVKIMAKVLAAEEVQVEMENLLVPVPARARSRAKSPGGFEVPGIPETPRVVVGDLLVRYNVGR